MCHSPLKCILFLKGRDGVLWQPLSFITSEDVSQSPERIFETRLINVDGKEYVNAYVKRGWEWMRKLFQAIRGSREKEHVSRWGKEMWRQTMWWGQRRRRLHVGPTMNQQLDVLPIKGFFQVKFKKCFIKILKIP